MDKNICITKHAVEKIKKIYWECYREPLEKPEEEILELLQRAREVKSRYPLFYLREKIVHGRRARHYKFRDLMIVTDIQSRVVITVYPIYSPRAWIRANP